MKRKPLPIAAARCPVDGEASGHQVAPGGRSPPPHTSLLSGLMALMFDLDLSQQYSKQHSQQYSQNIAPFCSDRRWKKIKEWLSPKRKTDRPKYPNNMPRKEKKLRVRSWKLHSFSATKPTFNIINVNMMWPEQKNQRRESNP